MSIESKRGKRRRRRIVRDRIYESDASESRSDMLAKSEARAAKQLDNRMSLAADEYRTAWGKVGQRYLDNTADAVPMDHGRYLSPDRLEAAQYEGTLPDLYYDALRYDEQGQPYYDPDQIESYGNQATWYAERLGRKRPTEHQVLEIQVLAVAALAGEEHVGIKVHDQETRRTLRKLANNDSVMETIESLRDKRKRGFEEGIYMGKKRKGPGVSAAQKEDMRKALYEWRRSRAA